MHKSLNVENLLFNSLDSYISKVVDKYTQTQDKESLLLNLVELEDVEEYNAFFVFSENLLDALRAGYNSDSILKEGFLIISPVKTNVAIGKGYEIFYCRNESRITPKNYISYGYIFVAAPGSVKEKTSDLVLCDVEEREIKVLGIKRLVELFPNLYAFFNSKGSRQILIFNRNNK